MGGAFLFFIILTSLAEQAQHSSESTCRHQDANQDQQAAADGVDDLIVLLDPIECRLEIIDEYCAQDKRNTQTQRVGQQHQHALHRVSLLGGQHQRGTGESANAGRPSQREDHAKEHGREDIHIFFHDAALAAPEQVNMKYAQKIQTEEDHNQSGNDIHSGLVFTQEASHRSGESAEDDKNDAESYDETQRPISVFRTLRSPPTAKY